MAIAQQVEILSASPELTDRRFAVYEALIRRWQPTVNLVSNQTLQEFSTRHLQDSAQIYPYLTEVKGPIADLGSGAGFPGMVLAMLGIAAMELVESDARKCAFLQTVARETNTHVTIRNCRISELPRGTYAAVTARACAPLADLLAYAAPVLMDHGYCVFLKGRNYRDEIAAARQAWHFDLADYPSVTSPEARVLVITGLRPLLSTSL